MMCSNGDNEGDKSPPILYLPDFCTNYEELFVLMRDTVEWDERMRVRKTANFGVPYNYGTMRYEHSPAFPTELESLCDNIERVLSYRPNNCLLNYYEDGKSSIGFHSDSAQNLEPGTGVAIVSLGCPRIMHFSEKANRSNEHRLELFPGSLLYMSLEMQQSWLHSIPSSAVPCTSRISLTFRNVSVSPPIEPSGVDIVQS